MDDVRTYKTVSRPGIAAVIICKRKVLLLRRRNVFFISNPGVWSILFGGIKRGEEPVETAYREIQEEVGLGRGHLKLRARGKVVLFDARRRQKWENWLFVFASDYDGVRKNYESSAVRWSGLNSMLNKKDYTNVFVNEPRFLRILKRFING